MGKRWNCCASECVAGLMEEVSSFKEPTRTRLDVQIKAYGYNNEDAEEDADADEIIEEEEDNYTDGINDEKDQHQNNIEVQIDSEKEES